MDRWACVDVPALALQLLLRQHPDWREWPVAVVDEDKPQGQILEVNGAARQAGILPGLRYGTALGLCQRLRAGTVSAAAVTAGVQELTERLRGWSPAIEPSESEPGVFWLDAGGLGHLYASLPEWARSVRQDLQAAGYLAAVVVGFSRFGTYAVARALRGRRALVFARATVETRTVRQVPLALLGLPPLARDALDKLGVQRVGAFCDLPAEGVLTRFGPEIHRLHRLATGSLDLPLRAVAAREPLVERVDLDWLETDLDRLAFLVKPMVDRLMAALARRGEALAELTVELDLDRQAPCQTRIRPAEPTLAGVQVVELVRLRLEALQLNAPVTAVALTAGGVKATAEQLQAFAETPKRDLAAASRAFARLRAAFGEDAVVRPRLLDRHLPEARFGWEPIDRIGVPAPRLTLSGPLVRRIQAKPEPLPPWPRQEPDGWLLRGHEHGPVVRLTGPYRLSGGWWQREIEREYHFAEMQSGELLWVYYDRGRRRWFLQGEVT